MIRAQSFWPRLINCIWNWGLPLQLELAMFLTLFCFSFFLSVCHGFGHYEQFITHVLNLQDKPMRSTRIDNHELGLRIMFKIRWRIRNLVAKANMKTASIYAGCVHDMGMKHMYDGYFLLVSCWTGLSTCREQRNIASSDVLDVCDNRWFFVKPAACNWKQMIFQ